MSVSTTKTAGGVESAGSTADASSSHGGDQGAGNWSGIDLECRSISKSFGSFKAVDDISFRIPHGAFFSILGPSGCGKTTLLRMLAGFQKPDGGDILIKGRSVLGTPPNRRPVNMVFQHLALFPTMTVAENIAYGLKRRGVAKHEQTTRIKEVLARIGLPESGSKQIDQLSGGQKQRIAIARCLVLEPSVLLLDEPLGALDLKLREQMKIELKQLQNEFNTTFVYITHDQSEALAMSDQVAVMNHGGFEQVGSPQSLYFEPATAFVAGFVGESNRLQATVSTIDGNTIELSGKSGMQLKSALPASQIDRLKQGDLASVFIRPEAISVREASQSDERFNTVRGRVETILFDGARSHFMVNVGETDEVQVQLPQTGPQANLRQGDNVELFWEASRSMCFQA